MTLTDEGRRVAERPAFPMFPGASEEDSEGYSAVCGGRPGMTIHEHATLELMKGQLAEIAHPNAPPIGPLGWEKRATEAALAADAYCNALGAREAGK